VPHYFQQLILGVVALAVTLVVRATTVNRLIRSKIRLSLLLFAAFVALNLFLARATVSSDLETRLTSVEQLLFALAAINLLVVIAINPLRADRVPEHFPNIVQDAIIIGLFLVMATFVLQEKFLTTSAVGAVVIGFALQDTLGNMFAGLAIQVEKPFRVGHWITVGGFEGLVAEITWRATKLRTKNGNFVIVPNNIISKEAITNFSEPALPTRLQIDVGASYEAPPTDVKTAIAEALEGLTLIAKSPAPEVGIAEFGSSAIVYRVKFWIDDYALDDRARGEVRAAIYYVFRRRQIEIPYPLEVHYAREPQPRRTPQRAMELEQLLQQVDLFAPLADADRAELVATSAERLYRAGEAIVRQGDPGDSMFVVCHGGAQVTIEPGNQELARCRVGGYFGEMSLLAGDSRSAWVRATGDCGVLEITADTVRRFAAAHPAVIEQISQIVASRRAELEHTKNMAPAPAVVEETRRSLLSRIREFLWLPGAGWHSGS
jgi:small-conductance mechanosensitive channel/CRP-like cAMP-binding protein